MNQLILDPADQAKIIEQRQETGLDRFDEVWEGVYLMSPLANNEHQQVALKLARCFDEIISDRGLGMVQQGANVSDRADGWEHNYRCPDVVVYLRTNPAVDHDTHWQGGADFAVEVVSRHDRSREKLDFYAQVNTRELLIVDRYPWSLELYRLSVGGTLELVGRSTIEQPDSLASVVLPVSFRLEPGEKRPRIVITHADGLQAWSA